MCTGVCVRVWTYDVLCGKSNFLHDYVCENYY